MMLGNPFSPCPAMRVVCLCFALWLALASLPSLAANPLPPLTPAERQYLARGETVRLCVDPDWAPFERINEQGQHEGIAADLLALVTQRTGLKLALLPVHNWEESLAASRSGRCQVMSFLNQSPARDQWLDFTSPIFLDPNVIIAREETPYIADLHSQAGKTVALPRGTAVEERIRRDYPELVPVLTESESEAIALVSERKVDMTIRSLVVAAYAIKKEGLFNLKIAGSVPDFNNRLRIGVIKGQPVLRSILEKGVATLTPLEREQIVNRHVAIQVQEGISLRTVWQVLAGLMVLFGLALLWMRKQKSLIRRLEYLSVTDRLTGVYNRMKLDEVLAAETLRAARSGRPFGVIMLDVDHFKQVNDRHGHQIGDRTLTELVGALRQRLRATDIIGRWGGEEFLLICPDTDLAGTARLADMLRQHIADQTFSSRDSQTASFGVACHRAMDSVEDLVSRADSALYRAKRDGRNRVCVST